MKYLYTWYLVHVECLPGGCKLPVRLEFARSGCCRVGCCVNVLITSRSRHRWLVDGNNEAGAHAYDDRQAADRSVRWREGWSAILVYISLVSLVLIIVGRRGNAGSAYSLARRTQQAISVFRGALH